MSYVLDALRRADAERARGDLPGLHAQPVPPMAPVAASAGRSRVPWVAFGALALLVAGALAIVAWPRGPGADGVAMPPAPPTGRAAGPAPSSEGAGDGRASPEVATAVALAPLPAQPSTAAAAPPRPVLSQPVPPRPVVREPASVPPSGSANSTSARPDAAAAGATARAEGAVDGAAALPPSPATPTAPNGPATPARLPTLAELPAALRQRLPAMAFGGATDSSVAAARMLLINGQVFREGDEVAPGLRLERIRLRSAEMRFEGRAFEVVY